MLASEQNVGEFEKIALIKRKRCKMVYFPTDLAILRKIYGSGEIRQIAGVPSAYYANEAN